MNRKVIVFPLAVALGLASVPLLAGCNPAQVIQDAAGNAVKEAVKDATGVDIATGSLPEGWPSSVPVVSGEIQQGGSIDLGGGMTYEVSIKVTDTAAALAEIRQQMSAAGFTADLDEDTDLLYSGVFSNAEHSVVVTMSKTGKDDTVSYVVAPAVTG